jgi:hypothetical protein
VQSAEMWHVLVQLKHAPTRLVGRPERMFHAGSVCC